MARIGSAGWEMGAALTKFPLNQFCLCDNLTLLVLGSLWNGFAAFTTLGLFLSSASCGTLSRVFQIRVGVNPRIF